MRQVDKDGRLISFGNYCTCGGFAWQMNGRPEAQPHMAWCAQHDEYAEWYHTRQIQQLKELDMSKPFVSMCCDGEKCFCGKPAEHKVCENVFDDDPLPHRHELTAYICHEHFRQIMGPAADRR